MNIKNLPSLDDRKNIIAVDYDKVTDLLGYKITLVDSGHMLGAAQIEVEDSNGYRVGYSGDFSMPLDRIIKVDELFVDGTYGDINANRAETMSEVISQFCELIENNKLSKSFFIRSHRGTLTHAMTILNDSFPDIPLLVSKKYAKEIEVYNQYGYNIDNYFTNTHPDYYNIKESNKFIKLMLKPEMHGGIPRNSIGIELLGIYGRNQAVTQTNANNYTVAFTNHADFSDTIDYIKETGAKKVYTDTKKDAIKAAEFASAIKLRLNIDACPAEINRDGN
jgi:putative mRNA 3-end processing factor